MLFCTSIHRVHENNTVCAAAIVREASMEVTRTERKQAPYTLSRNGAATTGACSYQRRYDAVVRHSIGNGVAEVTLIGRMQHSTGATQHRSTPFCRTVRQQL